ncbi:MAG TPA: DUF2844 domain-containing protein [Bdellovibrio sp.]|uniref:DUF2844 domain-containing protein n=1 Tax=Bdellovibrio sp. TaxID=28201 RepID=UPI002F0E4741
MKEHKGPGPVRGIQIALALCLLSSSSAFAVLGQRSDSVVKMATSMKAKIKAASTSSSAYTAQDVELNGTKIREYLNSDGVVFAVAWQGVIEPDLSSLLGDYYTEYSQALRTTEKSAATKRNLNIETTRMKVRKFGHMRSWHGLAYVSSLVPEGVSVEDLSL